MALKPSTYFLRMRMQYEICRKCFAGVQHKSTDANYSLLICDVHSRIRRKYELSIKSLLSVGWVPIPVITFVSLSKMFDYVLHFTWGIHGYMQGTRYTARQFRAIYSPRRLKEFYWPNDQVFMQPIILSNYQ